MEILDTALSVFFSTMPFVIVILIALMLWVFSIAGINNPFFTIAMMVFIFLCETSLMGPFALNLGLWVYLPDIFVLLVLPAFFYRLIALNKISMIPLAWWLLGVVQISLFAWGLMVNGTAAGVDYRPHFYVWLGAAYLATFNYDEDWAKRFLIFFTAMGLGVCIIAYYRWVMGAIDYHFYQELLRLDSTGVSFERVVASGPMFMTACAMLVSLYYVIIDRTKPLAWILTLLFGLTILAMQHRSVWVATIAGVLALIWGLSLVRSNATSKLFSISLVFVILLLIGVASGQFNGVLNSIDNQVISATSTTSGTFVGRVGGWQSLLKIWIDSHSPVTYLVGKPFGGGYERFEFGDLGGKSVGYMPHNYYVHLLYRGGLIGLFAFLWVIWRAIKVLLSRVRGKQDIVAPLLLAILIAQLIYFIPYELDYAQMILFGLLLSLITSEKHRLQAIKSAPSVFKSY